MRRGKAESLGDLLHQFLRQEGLETPLNERRLILAWSEVLGSAVDRYTGDMFIKNQILYVQLKSPALRDNLMMERDILVKRLNAVVGCQVIVNIIFR